VLYVAPLCPAGHLPLKGGDYAGRFSRTYSAVLAIWRGSNEGLISPLEGEMSGRTEGGNVGRGHNGFTHPTGELP